MRILIAHTNYQQPGGEDVVFQAERELLESNGHAVIPYQRSNYENGAASQALWSRQTYRELQILIQKTHPDVAHFHNTFFAISPSAYYACRQSGVPVVQTLHNFRLICPGALLLRDGKPCEDCLGLKIPLPGILHACWRDSHSKTAVVAAMLSLHHALGTWQNQIDRYIALTEFSRQKFIQGGLPPEKIAVKPNFLSAPIDNKEKKGSYSLFVGRLSQEKGLDMLLEAWQGLSNIPLQIVGDGPLNEFVRTVILENNLSQVKLAGSINREEVFAIMKNARFVVVPSKSYETFGLVALEAFSCGVPVIVPNLGNLAGLVEDGRFGLHFEARNAHDLAQKVTWAWEHPLEMNRMGKAAYNEYLQKYTPETNHRILMDIYQQAISTSQKNKK